MASVAENIASIRARVAEAAKASGRTASDIAIVAAAKMNSAERVREAVAAGISDIGENRVQELLAKLGEGAYDGVRLHFIGRLQKNKAKSVVGTASLIQSADSEELLALISALAVKRGVTQDVLVEVNIGMEAPKSGINADALPYLLEKCSVMPGVRVRGLMAIPPDTRLYGENKRFFSKMYQLFVDITPDKYDNVSMDFLSMGMTSDFEAAIEEGSNMIRIGSAIFGERY